MASSSPMSRSWTYNVFPSFYGPDVRKTFLGHLRKQFNYNGITMFDDQGIERSKTIEPALTQALRESRISIVVLSQNYASSRWCLDELVEILNCKHDMGQTVMPVFYEVDPSDVWEQTGDFGRAFEEFCASKTHEKRQRWSQALKEVASLIGVVSKRWENESDMIDMIARHVSDELNTRPSMYFEYMVGLEAHLEEMKYLLQLDDRHGVKMVGICAPSGIGKTIARALHSLFSSSFLLSCFMENLRESYSSGLNEYELKLCLQQQFLSKILNQNDMRIFHLGAMKERLCNQKVFIILDGVDDLLQLEALAGDIFWFGPGSRIIVTTENNDLLKRHGIDNSYHVDFPSKKEALEKNLEALEVEVQALNAMRNDLLKRVSKEEGRGLQVLPQVKGWIAMVEEIETTASRLLDKSISELQKLSKQDDISASTRHCYSDTVCKTLKEVETLKSKGVFGLLVDKAPLRRVLKKLQPLQPPVSLEKLLDSYTKCLSKEEAWDLFQEIVGETTLNSLPDIPQLARVVARKCGGSSFALYLMGVTMSSKRTARAWYDAIHILVSSPAEFSEMESDIFPIFKFSYDSLPNENIRLCFLYCALFRKDDDISKQELVDCLIGEGIFAEADREIAEIKGYEIISDLVRMGLLMENKSGGKVKMHDMVCEMALWIASDFGRQKEQFVVERGEGIHEMPRVSDWRMVRRMSVTSTQIDNISDSPNCSQLTTLFLNGNNNLKCISGEFFQRMTSLVVLNLSHNTGLSELPEEVSFLVSLGFLNLSWTSIERLPLGLKELKRLFHLDLDYTSSLKGIDVISSLFNLQVLRLFMSVPMDLSLMEGLQLLKSLKELSVTVKDSTVLQLLLSIPRLASCIQRLYLARTAITDGGIFSLNAMSSLGDILEISTDWKSNIAGEMVRSGNVEEISQFQNVHTVSLFKCKGLRDLTWLLLAPSLDDLTLHGCPQLEQIVSKEKAMAELGQTSEQPFQNLTRLSLNDLPELESIYWTPLGFPVLEDVIISRCPKLRRLPFNSKSAIGNQLRLDLDEEWIKDVEWEDKTTKQRFSGLNNRDFPMMAEEQKKMDDLETHPTQNKVLVGTTKSGERATASSISGKKVLQSEINVAGVALEPRHTHKVSTSEVLESSTIYAPGAEREGVLPGSFELDPAAIPEFKIISDEHREANLAKKKKHREANLAKKKKHREAPHYFICPITKEVMEDPQIAADGFTYGAEAISSWLERSETSPMTNTKFLHTKLVPNIALRYAIQEWHLRH